MSFNINLDQHRLLRDQDGTLVRSTDGNLAIIDHLSKCVRLQKSLSLSPKYLPAIYNISSYPIIKKTSFIRLHFIHSLHLSPVTHSHLSFIHLSGGQIEFIHRNQESDVINFVSVNQPRVISTVEASSLEQASNEVSIPEIWVKNSGKPTSEDLKARDLLVELVGSEKFSSQLTDKKTVKKNVWSDIGKIFLDKGFSFGNRDPGLVCSQKWRNMEAKTLEAIAKSGPRNTGGGKVVRPDYFEDVADVVKDKAKALPKNLVDSLACSSKGPSPGPANSLKRSKDESKGEDDEDEDDSDECDASKSISAGSPFMKVLSSSKPKKKKVENADLLMYMKEEAAERKAQNQKIIDLLGKKVEDDNMHKKALLETLQGIFK